MIAYQTAYLKANHPIEFFCSLMNCDINNSDKLSLYCDEIRKLGYEIIGPDINNSHSEFTVIKNNEGKKLLIYGLNAIKNIGENSIKYIINDRKKNGKFKNFSDLLKRISNNVLNKKILESLIFSDSLKNLEPNQKFLFDKIDSIISINSNYHKNLNINQGTLFADDKLFEDKINSKGYDNWTREFKLKKEREVIGFYLSDHPTKNIKKVYFNKNIKNLSSLKDNSNNGVSQIDSFIAVVDEINERVSKNGKRYCFLTIADDTLKIDAICFSEVLESLDFDLKKGKIYNFKISQQFKNENQRFIINNIRDIFSKK